MSDSIIPKNSLILDDLSDAEDNEKEIKTRQQKEAQKRTLAERERQIANSLRKKWKLGLSRGRIISKFHSDLEKNGCQLLEQLLLEREASASSSVPAPNPIVGNVQKTSAGAGKLPTIKSLCIAKIITKYGDEAFLYINDASIAETSDSDIVVVERESKFKNTSIKNGTLAHITPSFKGIIFENDASYNIYSSKGNQKVLWKKGVSDESDEDFSHPYPLIDSKIFFSDVDLACVEISEFTRNIYEDFNKLSEFNIANTKLNLSKLYDIISEYESRNKQVLVKLSTEKQEQKRNIGNVYRHIQMNPDDEKEFDTGKMVYEIVQKNETEKKIFRSNQIVNDFSFSISKIENGLRTLIESFSR